MFGEKEIIGESTIKVNRGRIIVPKFTYGEIDDDLLIMFGLMKNKLIIGQAENMMKLLEEVEKEMIELGVKQGQERFMFIRRARRFLYGQRCITEEKIDKQKRILIPKNAIEELNFGSQVFVIGNQNRLDIYKDEESYKKTLKNI